MRGFRFRMDPILRLRAAQLEARRAELQRESLRRDADQQAADSADERARISAAALEERLAAGTTAVMFRSEAGAQVMLRDASRRAAARVLESASNVSAARERVVEAWRRSRALETLRQRSLVRWQREGEKREQRATDEVAARRQAR
ncbi:MAG: flagellar FliJ family protein [Myxococcota bacterium]